MSKFYSGLLKSISKFKTVIKYFKIIMANFFAFLKFYSKFVLLNLLTNIEISLFEWLYHQVLDWNFKTSSSKVILSVCLKTNFWNLWNQIFCKQKLIKTMKIQNFKTRYEKTALWIPSLLGLYENSMYFVP